MTKERICANGAAMSAVRAHIQTAQDRSIRLSGLLEAAETLDNEGNCANGLTALICIANELSRELNDDLDSIRLPEVQS